jgi:hypothetical protein
MVGVPAACATDSQSLFRPTEQVSGLVEGVPAARYPVPPEAPRGDVNVSSRGVVSVQPQEGGREARMMHLRIAVANENDVGPWTVDAREQRVVYRGGATLSPAIVSTSAPGAPLLTVAPGQVATLDLHYQLPPGVDRAREVPRFELRWAVRTPARVVAERTPFERELLDRRDAEYDRAVVVGLAVSPLWWYDPNFYPYAPPYIYYPRYGYPHAYFDPGHRVRDRRPEPTDPGFRGMPTGPAPSVPATPNLSAPAAPPMPAPAPPPPAPPPPPAAPPVPTTPNLSAPARP